jgi:hypothetical protein
MKDSKKYLLGALGGVIIYILVTRVYEYFYL